MTSRFNLLIYMFVHPFILSFVHLLVLLLMFLRTKHQSNLKLTLVTKIIKWGKTSTEVAYLLRHSLRCMYDMVCSFISANAVGIYLCTVLSFWPPHPNLHTYLICWSVALTHFYLGAQSAAVITG